MSQSALKVSSVVVLGEAQKAISLAVKKPLLARPLFRRVVNATLVVLVAWPRSVALRLSLGFNTLSKRGG